MPRSRERNGASFPAANVYHDGQGDFLIIIPDAKANDESDQFQNLWAEIAFPLAPAEQFVVKEFFPKKVEQRFAGVCNNIAPGSSNIVLGHLLR